MTFNPPPGWPVPVDFSPTPTWQPDPAWSPAPPGWRFWVDDDVAALSDSAVGDDASRPMESPPPKRLSRRQISALVGAPVMLAVVVIAAVVGSFVLMRPPPATRIALTPMINGVEHPPNSNSAVIPDWPAPLANFVDFSSWTAFGGVDARLTDNGRTVLLDTHDTTDTWHTKWSGLIQQGEPLCGFRVTGRVRDTSHTVGVPGGFGIGMAYLGSGDPTGASLAGGAIQFDFGQNGYRLAVYPSDDDNGLVPARLDNHWHEIDFAVDDKTSTLLVDGRPAAQTMSPGQCGHPVIRVWAGAAEFTGFRFVS